MHVTNQSSMLRVEWKTIVTVYNINKSFRTVFCLTHDVYHLLIII